MGHHCCKAIYEKGIRSRVGHDECAAVTDQLLGANDCPGRFRGVGIFNSAIVLDPLPSRPKPKLLRHRERRSRIAWAVIG